MNHIALTQPLSMSRFRIKKPDELVIFETISQFLTHLITPHYIKRTHKTLVIKLLPSKKQMIKEKHDEIIQLLKQHDIFIEKII